MPRLSESLRSPGGQNDIESITNYLKQIRHEKEQADFYDRLKGWADKNLTGTVKEPTGRVSTETTIGEPVTPNLPAGPPGAAKPRSVFGEMTQQQIPEMRERPKSFADVPTQEYESLFEAAKVDPTKILEMYLSQGEAEREARRRQSEADISSERTLSREKRLADYRQGLKGPTGRNRATTQWESYLEAAGGDAKKALQMKLRDDLDKARTSASLRIGSRAPNVIDLVKEANKPGQAGVKGKQELKTWMEATGKKDQVLYTEKDGTVVYGIPADTSIGINQDIELYRQKPTGGKKTGGVNLLDFLKKKGVDSGGATGGDDKKDRAKKHLEEAGYESDDESVNTFLQNNPDF